MRLITRREEVLRRLHAAGRRATPILCPNAETPDEMEGVMLGAADCARDAGTGTALVGMGFTASYPEHAQLGGIALGNGTEPRAIAAAARTWLGWLAGYADRPGIFDDVEVIPFLDHGWVPNDADLQLMREEWFQDAVGIILFDASAFDVEENARLTAEFVRAASARVVVEACPDKVYSQAEILARRLPTRDMLSDPRRVEDFVRRTKVDLIVPNLGTEHRSAAAEPLEYRRPLAREIARRVGPIQALHGTSSLGGRLGSVGRDGICKVNYYTGMARGASKAVQSAWSEIPPGEALPIARACGSFVHRTRRAAGAASVRETIESLGGAAPIPPP